MTNRSKFISVAFVIVVVVGWTAYVVTKPDYACEAIKRYPGGEEALLKSLEDPTGKTPSDAANAAQLASAFRKDKTDHPEQHRC